MVQIDMDKQEKQLTFISLGGIGTVTRNMYVYEYNDEILLVDCGLGFADETMLGVDLLLPDISYLQNTKKKIIGMLITHAHEDHFGGLPFILPQLIAPNTSGFPIYATPLTAAFANEKLKEFGIPHTVQTVSFDKPDVTIGPFQAKFIRLTHSVPDTSNILIKTPLGNFYHGSDFKFDLTPADGKPTDFQSIAKAGQEGVRVLLCDALGSEREGPTGSEAGLQANFEKAMMNCKGKIIVTTYSSHIARLNQILGAARKLKRKVCFIGRSLLKTKDVAQKLGYMKIEDGLEVPIDELKSHTDEELLLFVAGSQGQEESAMYRIANGEHRDVKLSTDDLIIFSSDPIPGNELMVNALVDLLAERGTKVLYSPVTREFHVSGHGSAWDVLLMMTLTRPQHMIPIGAQFRQMTAFRDLAKRLGYKSSDVSMIDAGQELIFTENAVRKGQKHDIRNIYVDEITGEEVEHYVLRDRQKLSESGVAIVLAEVNSANGTLVASPDVIMRGFTADDHKKLQQVLHQEVQKVLSNKQGRVTNWVYLRKIVGEISEKVIFRVLRRRPLVLPVVIEV